ncbi:recombinase family protein [Citrobacter freundii]|uniref:recombinase family protein n=1 Tax=Citrobacter freundii complex TaxID=1344959 RepID=UPI001883494B|nr:recombinase family protein [Citrobacter werkmanii]MBF0035602.1 recombinase family protein [Citrobacter freundii]MBJ8869880.1 recombinase family protein [Citrobacter braakii]MBJ8901140.1 recombinase family protein [Citrobacter braakii]MBJ8905795.1 recombinase family protein [Citrobacter braakii]MBJ8919349.1 recombinase family protein [Citrobacter braakii]
MTSFVYAYLRASTDDQDANRARKELEDFAKEKGVRVAGWFVENESGAKLERPELFRLLDNTQPGDILLLEQVDRLSRLNADDWRRLRDTISAKGVRIVALDLPTSHMFMNQSGDEFTARMMDAINGMLLDMLAAIARKDYVDRRRRQRQGVEAAKLRNAYTGRKPDTEKHEQVITLRKAGITIDEIVKLTGVSRSTVFRVLKSVGSD